MSLFLNNIIDDAESEEADIEGNEKHVEGNEKPEEKAEGGRIGLANGTTMDAFESMTPNRKYMMTGESDVHRIQPPMGGILPLAGAGIFALSRKDKDKKKLSPLRTSLNKDPKYGMYVGRKTHHITPLYRRYNKLL